MKLRSIIAIALFAASAAYAKPAPDFTLMSLDGRTIHLAALRGKVVLLNFWATWCAGCQVEMPRLAALYRQHHQQGLEIIGVSMDDAGEDVIAKFARSKHADYTMQKETTLSPTPTAACVFCHKPSSSIETATSSRASPGRRRNGTWRN